MIGLNAKALSGFPARIALCQQSNCLKPSYCDAAGGGPPFPDAPAVLCHLLPPHGITLVNSEALSLLGMERENLAWHTVSQVLSELSFAKDLLQPPCSQAIGGQESSIGVVSVQIWGGVAGVFAVLQQHRYEPAKDIALLMVGNNALRAGKYY